MHRISKSIFFLTSLFFISIFIPQFVIGVGIGQYTDQKTTLFEPGLEKTYSFYLYDSPYIAASIEGDLSEYAIIKDPNPNGGPRNVEVVISLPEYIEPGLHVIYMTATQASPEGEGSVGGVAEVKTSMNVYALYPGIRPEFRAITANDLNVNEKSAIKINFINMGEEIIQEAKGTVTVYDEKNKTVAILDTNTITVKPFEVQSVVAILDASTYSLEPGKYWVKGTLTCDNENVNATMESSFIVGQLKVDIIDTTSDVIVNATNKYYITIESDWAGDINDVFVRVTMPNGKILKSPSIDLIKPEQQGRKAAGQIEMYMETDGIAVGTYNVDVTVNFRGLTSTKTVELNVIDGEAPAIEKPKLITSTTIVIGIGILILIFVVLYFFVFKHHTSSDADKTNVSKTNTQSDNDYIRPPSI